MKNKYKKHKFKYKYLVAPILLVMSFTLSIVCASFNQTMYINGEAYARVNRDVRIMSIERDSVTNGGLSTYNPKYAESSVIMYDTLPNLNSTVVYKIKIRNNTDNYINVYDVSNTVNNSISNASVTYEFDKTSLNSTYGSDLITPHTEQFVYVTIKYKTTVQTLPEETTNIAQLKFSFAPIYASELSYSNSTYTGCTNVQCALDSISTMLDITPNILCKRATSLHNETCTYTSGNYCYGAGFYVGGSKNTTTLTYGNLKLLGSTLEKGDAFDCDVNGDGVFNGNTERFYYLSDFYDTTTLTFDTSTAVMAYYSNVAAGVPNTSIKGFQYDSNNINYNGPVTAILQLPTTSQWSNITLKQTSRKIISSTRTESTYGGQLPTNFSYSGYAARLPVLSEIQTGCSASAPNGYYYVNKCLYLLENTAFANSSYLSTGMWYETPNSAESRYAYGLSSMTADLTNTRADVDIGVRPVIDVPKSRIAN